MTATSANARLEAFCDGVFAIALTLLVIEVRLESPPASIRTTAELWSAIAYIWPLIFAFLLSFVIILITWVNHHNTLKLIHRTSAPFVYANGLLLLSVAFIPFPTELLGEFIRTDHAGPAVVLFNAVLTVQALGWLAITGTALGEHLIRDDPGTVVIRAYRTNAFLALALYGTLTVLAIWLPFFVAMVTTASWLVWGTLGIQFKRSWPQA